LFLFFAQETNLKLRVSRSGILRKNSKERERERENACNGSFEVYPGIIAFVEWTIGEHNMEQSLPERLEHRLRYPDLQGAFHQMSVRSVQEASLQQ
jgi:hypothetical protein